MKFSSYPLLFDSSVVEKVWGGNKIANILKRKIGEKNQKIAESLEIFDREKHSSKITNGIYAGQSLNDLIKKFPQAVVSNDHKSHQLFPIIIKYLNPTQPTSVQVHPTQNFTKKNGGEKKLELWYILESSPNAHAYIGLKEKITKKCILKTINTEKILDYLQKFKLKKNDIYNISTGTIHCLSGESLILEIQDNSECTYRLFDWNRQRDIHLKEAIEATDFWVLKNPLHNKLNDIISVPHSNFIVTELFFDNEYKSSTQYSCQIIIPLSNDIVVLHNSIEYPLTQYSPVLLPQQLGKYTLLSNQKSCVITVVLKDVQNK